MYRLPLLYQMGFLPGTMLADFDLAGIFMVMYML